MTLIELNKYCASGIKQQMIINIENKENKSMDRGLSIFERRFWKFAEWGKMEAGKLFCVTLKEDNEKKIKTSVFIYLLSKWM